MVKAVRYGGKKKALRKAKRSYRSSTRTKRYSKYKSKRMRSMIKKSLKHSILVQTQGVDNNNLAVMRSLIEKSNKYFGLTINNSSPQVILGSADVQTIGPAIMRAIEDKHTNMVRSLKTDTGFVTQTPHISYHGIAIKVFGNAKKGANDDEHTYPMLYHQSSESFPLNDIVFVSGKIYLKFPKQIQAPGDIVRLWPLHLCIFNGESVKLKVYYSVIGPAGPGTKGEATQFKLSTADYGKKDAQGNIMSTDWTKTRWKYYDARRGILAP